MKKILSLALCLLFITGCSTQQPKLIQTTDPYTQESEFAFGPIIPNLCPDAKYDGFVVDVSVLKKGDLQALSIGIEANDWAFLNPKFPLNILVDGKPRTLSAIDGTNRETHRRHGFVTVTEALYFPVTQSFISDLASAQKVQFRLTGDKRSVERCLDAQSLRQLEQVVPLLSQTSAF